MTLADDGAVGAAVAADAELARGTTIDRYVILDRLGAGGMGVVYAAYDHALDRKVAIKLVAPGARADAHDRVLAEAKAMARLADPRVVAVHDVGEYRGQIYIAMEHVEGRTLRAHLAAEPLTPRARLELLREGGAGHAAAHRGGVIHRAFQPDNVLIARDGRPKGADFGRAHTATHDTGDDHRSGTPGYMSPEQAAGEPTDPRTDQFAFCVTAIEALTGARDPQVSVATLARVVPRRVARALVRGVAAAPAARWPTMDALLAAIAPRARRWWTLAVAGVLTAVAVVALVVTRRAPRAGLRCDQAGAPFAALWSPARTVALGPRLARLGLAIDGAAVAAEISRRTAGWRDAAQTSCVATRDGRQAPAIHDLRARCLELALARTRGQLADLDADDPERVRFAVRALTALDRNDCSRDDELLGWEPTLPPASQSDELLAIQAASARADALAEDGRYDEARAGFAAARVRAAALGFAPLLAEIDLLRGIAENFAGRGDEAATALFAAIANGEAAGAGRIVTTAWIQLVYVQGYLRHRPGDALRFADIARARVRRDPSERADAEVVLDGAVGSLLADHGDPRAALPYLERQLAFFDDGHDPSNLVAALQALADARASLGDHDEAHRLAARAVAASIQTLGADHPSTLVSITVQTEVLVRAGRGDRAAEAEAVATAALARPPDVLDESTRAVLLRNRGWARFLLGRLDPARADLEQALAIFTAVSAPDASELQRTRYYLARVERAAGHQPRARALLDRALADTAAVPAELAAYIEYVPRAELEAARGARP